MSLTDELLTRYGLWGILVGEEYVSRDVVLAINEALEKAAQQCERLDIPDYCDGSWYAKQIRLLKGDENAAK